MSDRKDEMVKRALDREKQKTCAILFSHSLPHPEMQNATRAQRLSCPIWGMRRS